MERALIVTRGAGATDVGQQRDSNQDGFLADDALGLYAVADGMGGHAAGEVAAGLALATLASSFAPDRQGMDPGLTGDELAAELRALLDRAMLQACAAVHQEASSGDPANRGMGSTLTALACANEHAVLAHVGDSRAYLLREGTVHQLTTDHTFAAELVRAGALEPTKARTHPHAHVLLRALGPQPAVAVELLVAPIRDGDRFLLSSDGLTEYIPDLAWLVEALETESQNDLLAELIAHANQAGGRDNISVVCIDVQEAGGPSADVDTRFAALGAVPLFEGLSLASVSRVLASCQTQDFRAGDVVFDVGDPRRGLIVVLSGEFSLSADAEGNERCLAAGEYIGATTLVRERASRRALTCVDGGQALFLWSDRLADLAKRRPALGVKLYARLAARLATDLETALADVREGRRESGRSPESF